MTQSKGLKIWYLLPTMNLGGSERHVIHLASGLRRRNQEVGIACIFQEGVLAEEVRSEGIPFVCLHSPNHWGPATLLRIFRWICSQPMDILHTYLFGFHFFGGFPARFLKVPVIVSSRRDMDYWQRRRDLWIENLGNYFVDRVVCCAKEVERWTLQRENIPAEKVSTLYNGVDLNRFRSEISCGKVRRELEIPQEALLIGAIANFSHKKGYAYLLEAIPHILKQIPSARFLFVGSGPLEGEIRERAKGMIDSHQLFFAGARSDIPDLISAMDLFVLASLSEGLPNVLLEAMAMAKPVVATKVGGIPELIESGVDGILVPSKDAGALTEAILSLLKDSEKARAMGERGQEKVRRNFTLERMIEEYEAFYLSL